MRRERATAPNTTESWEAAPEILTVKEAAALLAMRPKTVYESIKLGIIPAVRTSPGTIRLSKTNLRRWFQASAQPEET
jgi:excisionase family DNA binding protein